MKILYVIVLLLVLLYECITKQLRRNNIHDNHHLHKARGRHKRIAVLWTLIDGNLPYYFELTLATLLNGGADMIDIHLILPEIPQQYRNNIDNDGNYMNILHHNNHNNNENNNKNGKNILYSNPINQVFFHAVDPSSWLKRINEKLNITLPYDIKTSMKKVADMKPMLGYLFQDFIPFDEYNYWIYGDYDGFFGSYNNMIDYKILHEYDVISGISYADQDITVFAGTAIRCTGAWTMWRNTHFINTLFMRSINWEKMLQDGKEVYAFDEQTRPRYPGEESMNMVLELSHDVRQCCINDRIPSVKKRNSSVIIAEMVRRFVEMPGGTLSFKWERNKGISVVADGPFGFAEVYKREVLNHVLFFHFLDWKYCCGIELEAGIKGLIKSVSEKQMTVFDINCFTFIGSNFHNITFSLC